MSHPEVIKYYGVSYDTLEASKEQTKFFADLEQDETGMWWAICSLDNDAFYGAAGFNNLSKIDHKAEIGFWLLPEYWGTGMMMEALPIICKYGFNNMGLERIEGIVESENACSKNVLINLGFMKERTMEDCEIKNGNLISLDVFARSNTDLKP